MINHLVHSQKIKQTEDFTSLTLQFSLGNLAKYFVDYFFLCVSMQAVKFLKKEFKAI